MNIDEEQIKTLLEEIKPSIMRGFKKEIKEVVEQKIKWEAQEIIGSYVRDWIKENIIPELQKNLVESKEGLILMGIKLTEAIVADLSHSITIHMKEKLENTWERKKILEALFK